MRVFFIFMFIFLNLDNSEGVNQTYEFTSTSTATIEVVTDTIEVVTDIEDVASILELVPDSIEVEFCNVLRDFANPRGFDWKLILLLMYNESLLNTTRVGNGGLTSYVGLIMFGTVAREGLGVTRDSVLQMNHVEQAKLAVKMWEKVEAWGSKYKIVDFLSLQLATFSPAWIPYRHQAILPADSLTKAYNPTLVDSQGNITPTMVLSHYKKKVFSNKNLKYFQKFF